MWRHIIKPTGTKVILEILIVLWTWVIGLNVFGYIFWFNLGCKPRGPMGYDICTYYRWYERIKVEDIPFWIILYIGIGLLEVGLKKIGKWKYYQWLVGFLTMVTITLIMVLRWQGFY
jgi:hypothetical protein